MQLRWLPLVGLAWLATICTQTPPLADGLECTGIGYPDLPGGFVDLGGSVIGTRDGTEYGFAHVCRGKKHQIRLQRVSSRDQEGNPRWEDIDTLSLPRLGSDEVLVFGRWSTCRTGGQPDPAIVAIVVQTEEAEYTVVRVAWRANLESKKIERISPTGLLCTNDDCGM